MNGRVEIPEAEVLVQGYLESTLTEQESARLRVLLRQDPSAVDQILSGLRYDLLIRAVLAERMLAETALPVGELRPGSPLLEWAGAFLRLLRGNSWACGTLGLVAIVIFGLWLWGFFLQMGEPVLAQVDGVGLTLERNGQSMQAREGVRLQAGDRLRTAAAVTATLTFAPEKTRITLQPGTDFRMPTFSHGKRFALLLGKLEASVAPQRPFRPMIVITPQAEARVLGTKFTLTATATATRLEVIEGAVRFTRLSDGARIKVGKAQYTIAATNVDFAPLPQTGTILYEYWTNIQGNATHPLLELAKDRQRFPAHPDKRELLVKFEVSPDWGDNFIDRFRGYLHPPSTGDYTFSLAGSESSLLLSSSEAPDQAIPIASTDVMQETLPVTQQSVPLTLTAGRCYYIEVIRVGRKGPHHLAVSWQPPGAAREIISGNFLSPFKPENQKDTKP
jgi:FecR protein/PA14 domain